MKKLLFLLILCPIFIWAKPVTIKGNVQGTKGGHFSNRPFELLLNKDFITFKSELIKSGSTDAFGNFEISADFTETGFVQLKFDKIERTLFVVPGKSYYINVKAPIQELDNSHGYFAKDVQKAEIKNQYPTELNYLIDSLDEACSQFLAFDVIGRKRYDSIIAFTNEQREKFTNIGGEYFQTYLTFKCAEMEMFVMRKFRQKFIDKYFMNAQNIAQNIQAMHVFNTFFKGHLRTEILVNEKSAFHSYMNKGQVENMIKEIYTGEKYNREFNELLFLKGLQENFQSNYYRKSKINFALDYVIRTSNNPLHKTIAQNIRLQVTKLENGYAAPELKINYDTTNFDLADYKGKYVYIIFFKAWDTSFEKEIEIIDYLAQRYEHNLEIVCISTDIDIKQYRSFLETHNIKWRFYHYNFNNQILIDFDLQDFRIDRTDLQQTQKYILIDPKGRILYLPAKSPSAGFEYDFRRLVNE